MERGNEAPGALTTAAGQAVRWNAAAAIATLVSQLLQIVFLARWLTPAEFGLAAVAVSVAAFLQGFCDLGLSNALVQRDVVSRETWSSAWWATAGAGVVLALALVLFASPLESLLHLGGLAPLLVAAALSLPGVGPAAVFQADLQRGLRFRRLAAAEILAALASLLAALGYAWWQHARGAAHGMADMGGGAGALVAGLVALSLVRLAALWAFSTLSFTWRLQGRDLAPLTAFGGYQLGERTLSFALTNLDRILVARLLGPAATGYYTMASQIALRPAALLGPFIGRTLLPLLARLQGERARMAAAYLRTLSTLGLVSAFVYALLFGLAHPLVTLALGPGWEPAVLVLRILSLLGFLTVLGNALGNLTMATGRARFAFWLTAITLAARLGGVLLGARYGLTGVAVVMTVLMVVSLPLDIIMPIRWLGIPAGESLRAGGWVLLPAVLSAAALTALSVHTTLSPWTEVFVLGLPGALFFVGLAWILHRRRLNDALQEIAAKLR